MIVGVISVILILALCFLAYHFRDFFRYIIFDRAGFSQSSVGDFAEKSQPVPKVVFLKLHKTGGTTLASSILFPFCIRNHLKFMVPKGWWAIHPKVVKKGKYHMLFRHFPDYPQPYARRWLKDSIGDYRVVTLIREPVSRAISHYNHTVKRFPDLSFDEYLEENHEANHQSRWLGFDGQDERFLKTHFNAVGLTHRFDESMILFRTVFNMSLAEMLYVSQRNNVPKVISSGDLSEDQIARLRQIDWLDLQLFTQAELLFDQEIAKLDKLNEDLTLYKTALKDYSHPLWQERGSFPIGYSLVGHWAKFMSNKQCVKTIYELT